MKLPPAISENVVILTRAEFEEAITAAFRRGVERGRFEEGYERSNSAPPGLSGAHEGAVDSHGTQAQLAGGWRRKINDVLLAFRRATSRRNSQA